MTKNWKIRKDLSIEFDGHKLFRIECTKDFAEIKAGTLGGYIEKEENLIGNAWISDDAKVYDKAHVYGNANVSCRACVYGNAKVYGSAWISGGSHVSFNAEVYGNARVYGNACISGNACVYGDALVHDDVKVYGKAKVFDNACVYGDALVHGDALVYSNAKVSGDEIKSRKDVCHISNRFYDITITPLRIKIGCQCHAQDAWWNFTDKQIEKMDGQNALDFWKIWKEPLKQICDTMKKEKEI